MQMHNTLRPMPPEGRSKTVSYMGGINKGTIRARVMITSPHDLGPLAACGSVGAGRFSCTVRIVFSSHNHNRLILAVTEAVIRTPFVISV